MQLFKPSISMASEPLWESIFSKWYQVGQNTHWPRKEENVFISRKQGNSHFKRHNLYSPIVLEWIGFSSPVKPSHHYNLGYETASLSNEESAIPEQHCICSFHTTVKSFLKCSQDHNLHKNSQGKDIAYTLCRDHNNMETLPESEW